MLDHMQAGVIRGRWRGCGKTGDGVRGTKSLPHLLSRTQECGLFTLLISSHWSLTVWPHHTVGAVEEEKGGKGERWSRRLIDVVVNAEATGKGVVA